MEPVKLYLLVLAPVDSGLDSFLSLDTPLVRGWGGGRGMGEVEPLVAALPVLDNNEELEHESWTGEASMRQNLHRASDITNTFDDKYFRFKRCS